MKRITVVLLLFSSFLFNQPQSAGQKSSAVKTIPPGQINNPIEPNAGNWRTWVISSGRDYRVPAPPGASETREELRTIADLMANNDQAVRQQIKFWDAGAPQYRWIDLINARLLAGTRTTTYPLEQQPIPIESTHT